MKVQFYDNIQDDFIKFAVIVCQYQKQWIFVKHKKRDTYEVPGGHRENGESIQETAHRELYEETGAKQYQLYPICIYSVTGPTRVNQSGEESYGQLFYAEVQQFGELPESEIEKVMLFQELPTNWTYPEIQPLLIQKVLQNFMI